MSQKIWMNLPVKDVVKSTTFFNEIGFHAGECWQRESPACHRLNNYFLFPDATFEKFTGAKTVRYFP